MRGEETQLLGLITVRKLTNATVCIPGTHSKWAVVEDGAVESFKTFMTGWLRFAPYSLAVLVSWSLAARNPTARTCSWPTT
jgi:2-dehydro-3-deoxygalactonokinase